MRAIGEQAGGRLMVRRTGRRCGGCSQQRRRRRPPTRDHRRRVHRRVGQRRQRRRRRPRDRSSRSSTAPPPTRTRSRPPPPTPPRSPTRRWSSTTAAATTTGSTTCSPATPDVDAVDAYSLLPAPSRSRANEHVFYDLEHRQGRRRPDRRPARRDRCRRTPTTTGPTPPSSASRPTTIAAHRARDRPGPPRRGQWWRPSPSRTTCWSTPESPTRPRRGSASAVEEDADPSPADLAAMLDLINTHQVSALLFNPQTADGGHQADPGRRAARLRSGRHGDRDPPERAPTT